MRKVTTVRNRMITLTMATLIAATAMVGLGATSARADVRGWTTLDEQWNPYAVTLICKQYRTGAYGAVWRIRTAALASPDSRAEVKVHVYRNASWGSYRVNRSIASTHWDGQWDSAETFASIELHDFIWVYTSISNGHQGASGWRQMPMNEVGFCT